MTAPTPSTIEASFSSRVKRKVYANVVLPAFLISIIAYLDRNNLSFATLTMNSDLKFSETAYGIGAGMFFVGYLLFEIPGALIAERHSAKWWLARIMISWGILSGMMALVTEVWHFYTLRFLIGAAEASLYPVLYATVIPRWFNSADRARAIAIMLASLQVSAMIGAPLAVWLIEQPMLGLKGWQGLFLIEAIPAVLLGVIVVYWMADWPADARWLDDDEKRYLQAQYQAAREQVAHGSTARRRHDSWLEALAEPRVWWLCCIYFLWMTGYWGFNYYAPKILTSHGWSKTTVGWLVSSAMFLSLLVMLLVGHNSSRTGEKRWHGALCLFAATIGFLTCSLASDPTIATCALCLVCIGVYAALGVWWSYPTTFLSGAAAAGAVGLINSVGSCGGFFGPSLVGILRDNTHSYSSALQLLAVCTALAGGAILLLVKPTIVAEPRRGSAESLTHS